MKDHVINKYYNQSLLENVKPLKYFLGVTPSAAHKYFGTIFEFSIEL